MGLAKKMLFCVRAQPSSPWQPQIQKANHHCWVDCSDTRGFVVFFWGLPIELAYLYNRYIMIYRYIKKYRYNMIWYMYIYIIYIWFIPLKVVMFFAVEVGFLQVLGDLPTLLRAASDFAKVQSRGYSWSSWWISLGSRCWGFLRIFPGCLVWM